MMSFPAAVVVDDEHHYYHEDEGEADTHGGEPIGHLEEAASGRVLGFSKPGEILKFGEIRVV
jgi:hypothetical protein